MTNYRSKQRRFRPDGNNNIRRRCRDNIVGNNLSCWCYQKSSTGKKWLNSTLVIVVFYKSKSSTVKHIILFWFDFVNRLLAFQLRWYARLLTFTNKREYLHYTMVWHLHLLEPFPLLVLYFLHTSIQRSLCILYKYLVIWSTKNIIWNSYEWQLLQKFYPKYFWFSQLVLGFE